MLLLYNVTLYMFSGLTIWSWMFNWWTSPQEDYFSHSQHPLVPCSFLCRLRPQELCSAHFRMSTGVLLVEVTLRQPCRWDFVNLTSFIFFGHFFWRPNLTANSLPLALTFSPPPSSARSTKLRSRNWASMCPLGLGSSTRNFNLLKCSVMVSVRLQRKVSWPWGRTPLSEGQTFRMKEKGVPQILKLPQVSFIIFGILKTGWQKNMLI